MHSSQVIVMHSRQIIVMHSREVIKHSRQVIMHSRQVIIVLHSRQVFMHSRQVNIVITQFCYCSSVLDMSLDSAEIRVQDSSSTIADVARNPWGREMAWDFVTTQYADIFSK